jgi:hypothetical protein
MTPASVDMAAAPQQLQQQWQQPRLQRKQQRQQLQQQRCGSNSSSYGSSSNSNSSSVDSYGGSSNSSSVDSYGSSSSGSVDSNGSSSSGSVNSSGNSSSGSDNGSDSSSNNGAGSDAAPTAVMAAAAAKVSPTSPSLRTPCNPRPTSIDVALWLARKIEGEGGWFVVQTASERRLNPPERFHAVPVQVQQKGRTGPEVQFLVQPKRPKTGPNWTSATLGSSLEYLNLCAVGGLSDRTGAGGIFEFKVTLAKNITVSRH